jgi:hypothetical protein
MSQEGFGFVQRSDKVLFEARTMAPESAGFNVFSVTEAKNADTIVRDSEHSLGKCFPSKRGAIFSMLRHLSCCSVIDFAIWHISASFVFRCENSRYQISASEWLWENEYDYDCDSGDSTVRVRYRSVRDSAATREGRSRRQQYRTG